ncbi:type I-E CRISPR-associated protein Cse2/CasB [Spiractinospora alimapuensis]|uniref:type I-E CRISPR-associated protein Cse2/CasB n=1 Tax=Spiractinospora alimapuensis TaxID=2820884 RepID=UPI0022A9F756|nr:type I-E CRISPR-associated protein Cse2/CasB [Spiractinospora alimapuensis]QVQ51591.1 type I-E CRISPR-associated protein Cse2/CasB [Spiractinospora alimapuensis]
MSSQPADDSPARRLASILYRVGRDLDSNVQAVAGPARGWLARMRRSLTDHHYIPDVYDVLIDAGVKFESDAERDRPWLLTCGLFALNPAEPQGGEWRLTLGSALARLGDHPAAEARVRQLTASNYDQVASRLPSVMKQLSSKGISISVRSLAEDLVALHTAKSGSTEEHRVHLTWARDYKRRSHQYGKTKPQSPEEGTDQ